MRGQVKSSKRSSSKRTSAKRTKSSSRAGTSNRKASGTKRVVKKSPVARTSSAGKTRASSRKASSRKASSRSVSTRKRSTRSSRSGTSSYFRAPTNSGNSKKSRNSKTSRPKSRRKASLKSTEVGKIQALYLMVLFGGITLFGLIILLSASSVSGQYQFGDSLQLFRRQLVWAGLGSIIFVFLSQIDYRILRKFVPVLVAVSAILLVLVLIPGMGVNVNGSSRWLSIGPVIIQPAEIAKIALIIFTAHLLTLRERRMNRPDLTVRPVMLTFLVFAVLLALQPKLGTIVVLAFTLMVMMFIGGTKVRFLFPWVAGGSVGFVLAVLNSSYARERVEAFLDPMANQQGIAYQTIQSQVATANGGITGVGLGAGRAKYGFLPEVESDFIFANLAEETGLIGSTAVICFYALISWFGLRAAINAPDRFGMLLATGITSLIVSQAFLNIGVVLGVVPTTGVPLPFISAGGSSLVMMLAAAGLLTNVASRAKT